MANLLRNFIFKFICLTDIQTQCIFVEYHMMFWHMYTFCNVQIRVVLFPQTFIVSLWWKHSKFFLLAFLKWTLHYCYLLSPYFAKEHQNLLLQSNYNLLSVDLVFLILPSLLPVSVTTIFLYTSLGLIFYIPCISEIMQCLSFCARISLFLWLPYILLCNISGFLIMLSLSILQSVDT
jgi:hypothetical protein